MIAAVKMGRSAHAGPIRRADDRAAWTSATRSTVIEDDLSGDLGRRVVGRGVEAIEEYLAKHLAFLSFLDDAATA